jgi:hypothetical protein
MLGLTFWRLIISPSIEVWGIPLQNITTILCTPALTTYSNKKLNYSTWQGLATIRGSNASSVASIEQSLPIPKLIV